jgi:hypothetical protein
MPYTFADFARDMVASSSVAIHDEDFTRRLEAELRARMPSNLHPLVGVLSYWSAEVEAWALEYKE